MKKFDVFIADPPWDYGGTNCLAKKSCFSGGNGVHYPTSKSTALHDMRKHLDRVMNKDSLCFMWTSGATLKEAITLMESWGYQFKQVAFVWDKVVGTPGNYTYTQCEFVIVGKKGRIPQPYGQSLVHQFVSSRKGKHSVKPEEVQDRIDKMFWSQNKLELFARRHRVGWTCLGNELSGLDIRDDLDALIIDNEDDL